MPKTFAQTWWSWLTDYPSTAARVFASTLLSTVYVLVVVGCLATGRSLNVDVMERVQWFLFGMMTADVLQYVGKRATWKKDAPPGGEGMGGGGGGGPTGTTGGGGGV